MTFCVSAVTAHFQPLFHEHPQESKMITLKEERILFPIVRQLEASNEHQEFHCGSVANPIRQMEHEHDQAGDALAILNESTDGYTPPVWACNTYRAMLDSLARLEADMHQHIHKENNVLFPKAIQLEHGQV
ncbi:MAG: hemerythrin domain-containing protein [Pirellulaceae bacterium]